MTELERTTGQVDFILLDGSASMATKWNDSLAAINGYVDVLKAECINTQIVLSEFATRVGEILRHEHVQMWQPLTKANIPFYFGSTHLYDAINHMGRFMRELDPPVASLVIVTDGEEVGSQYTDETQARSILDWCRAKGWQVTFIGCDFNNSKQAKMLGASDESCVGVQKALMGKAGTTLGKKRAHHAKTGDDMAFSDDEKTKFGGYLAAPSK